MLSGIFAFMSYTQKKNILQKKSKMFLNLENNVSHMVWVFIFQKNIISKL